MSESVIVVSRFRQEYGKDPEVDYEPWEFQPANGYVKNIQKNKDYNFDYALTMEADQENMYINAAKKQINDFINGINVTIFAYGKTGSGKTFSMTGPESVTDSLKDNFSNITEEVQKLFGIIPRGCIDIFEGINAFIAEGCTVKLTTSYIETYMEKVYDLLAKERTEITLKLNNGLYVMPGLTKRECMTPEEIFRVISDGTANKKTAFTKQNARSSRSHTVLIIELEKGEMSGSKVNSKLFLVDLAGSERQSKTEAEGTTKEEGIKINQSLTSLGSVIMEVSKNPGKIPIRLKDSKLTMILKESFCGNCRLTLLVTCSILKDNADEAVNSLDFAKRAKMIKKKVTKNVVLSVGELEYLANALKEEIMNLRGQIIKSGNKYNFLKDKKILSFIKNEEIKTEGAEGEGGENPEAEEDAKSDKSDEEKPNDKPVELPISSGAISGFAATRGNIALRKRGSILHVDEETIIMKYCEVKARLENLEAATRNRYLQDSCKDAEADQIIDEVREDTTKKIVEIEEKKIEEVRRINENLDKIKEEFLKEKTEIEKRCTIFESEKLTCQDLMETTKKELDGIKDIMSLIENDNMNIQEKFEKKKLKYKQLKEKTKEMENEKNGKKDELAKIANEINDLKIKDIEQIKEIEKLKAENIAQSKIISEDQKTKLLTEKVDSILDEITNNKKTVLSLSNKEKSMTEEIEELKKKLKDKETEIANQGKFIKEKDERIQSLLVSNEAKEARENKEKSNDETKGLEDQIDKLKIELQFKNKEFNDINIQWMETKAEYKILQNTYERLSINYHEKDLEIEALKKKNLLNRNSVISHKVDMSKSKNTFGFILKKTNNKYLNEAKEKAIETKDILETLNKDRIEELKKLQCNIAVWSPQTVSSVSIQSDLPEIDFNDEEGYEKIMKEREEREKERQERKKKQKEEKEKAKMNK